jgi:hypothetical protein
MTPTRWIAAAVLLVAAGAVLFACWPSEERRVRARLESLAETLSVPAKEGDLERLARAQRLRTALREDVTVAFEREQLPALSGRDAVAALVARPWPMTSGGVKVELQDLVITLDAARTSADVRFTARVTALDPASNQSTLDGRMVSLTMARVEGVWLVSSARILQSDESIR